MADPRDPRSLLLIFDLDGTLYDTRTSFLPTMRSVYADYGLPYPSDAVILGFVGEPFPVFLDWLRENGFPGRPDALAEHIARIELASIRERGALFPGVHETLRDLDDRGHVLALCTNGDRRYADAVLSRGGIRRLFAELQTNETQGSTKSELVADLLGRVPHERAVMIGDRYHDVRAGRANGCAVIGAAYGYGAPDELADADRLIGSFSELPRALEGIPRARPGSA